MGITNLTKDNFEAEVLKCDKPVLIDFSAAWCGPCNMLAPIIDEVAAEQEDIKVCKVDIDDQIQLAQQFRVMSVPTLIVMKHGKVVNQSVGLIPKAKVLSLLK